VLAVCVEGKAFNLDSERRMEQTLLYAGHRVPCGVLERVAAM